MSGKVLLLIIANAFPMKEAESEQEAMRLRRERRFVLGELTLNVLGTVPWLVCYLIDNNSRARWPLAVSYGTSVLVLVLAGLVLLYRKRKNAV